MDYRKMMMETPEETMKRFERKRKLKEVLCEYGLYAHKVQVDNTPHFAFALATPIGIPIAHPCSSEDLAECSQWLASKYPYHYFFRERQSVYQPQAVLGRDARFGTKIPSDSKPLQCDLINQLASEDIDGDLRSTNEQRSYDLLYGSIRDAHLDLGVEERRHELRRIDDLRDDPRLRERASFFESFVSPWDTPPRTDSPDTKRTISPSRIWKELEMARERGHRIPEMRSGGHEQERGYELQMARERGDRISERRGGHGHEHGRGYELEKAREGGHRRSERRSGGHEQGRGHEQFKRSREEGCHLEREICHSEREERRSGHDALSERGGRHGEHQHRTEGEEFFDTNRHHASRDGASSRAMTLGDRTGTGQNQTPRSDEGSGICGQDLSAPTTNPLQYMSEGNDTRSKDNPDCYIVVVDEDLIRQGVKGEKTLAWKPSPLYQAAGTPAPEKSESSLDSVYTSDNDQDYDDEACEREERTLIRYLRLFADDKSWKEGFESSEGLTCDVCNLGGKMKRVPDVKALVSHAKTMKKIKMVEHRGYARAICELMNLDVVALDHVNQVPNDTSKNLDDDTIVWPPVLVLENTRTVKGPEGQWMGVEEAELTEVLQVALPHLGSHNFRPICGKNGHKGRVLVEFSPSRQAWVDTTTLHKQFKMNARGYTEWLAVKPRWRHLGPESIKDGTDFVRLDDTGKPKRVLYGYLAEPRHMEVFDPSRKYVQDWKLVSKKILQQVPNAPHDVVAPDMPRHKEEETVVSCVGS